MRISAVLALFAATATGAKAGCPFLKQQQQANQTRSFRALNEGFGDGGIPEGGYTAVKADLDSLFYDSQAFWPADFEETGTAHYGGLFIRLAWHCTGSYRESDGRGGCDGGRIRYDPEINWPDNANLDQALKLLEPIKEKYGSQLSWGDLIVLAGTQAIVEMGGPVLGFCGGRIDEADGAASLKLGPSAEQEEIGPCQSLETSLQGQCLSVEGTALGPTTVGLIYVNPGGPVGAEDDPIASGHDIRQAFGNMGFSDQETVALVGGGHAFGKTHGACSTPPCGDGSDKGIGLNTFSSGFEGAWTVTPTVWTNDYFNNLFDFEWFLEEGPGGNNQWAPVDGPDIMMLTSDIALSVDELYRPISLNYAADLAALEEDFAAVWYRLTTSDMGPMSRCIGDDIPPAQAFQNVLPEAPEDLPDYVTARECIQGLVDEYGATPFTNLAYRCASTFRATDYRGGCNGARIRFSPESEWSENAGTAEALELLEPCKELYPDVSYADFIVLAGLTATESTNSEVNLRFCGGGVDAADAINSDHLAPRHYSPAVVSVRDDFQVKGLTTEEGVALAARETLSSQYFQDLQSGNGEFSDYELALLEEEFAPVVAHFALEEAAFLVAFSDAWTKMMTADRFLSPTGNACYGVDTQTLADCQPCQEGGSGRKLHFGGLPCCE